MNVFPPSRQFVTRQRIALRMNDFLLSRFSAINLR